MANEQNLRPPWNPNEAREAGRIGGVASGEARRKRKACAEIAMRVIASELSGKDRAKVEAVTGKLDDDEATLYAAAFAQVVAKAIKGDVHAFRAMQEVIDKAQGGNLAQEREEDALSAALKEIGSNL